MTTDASEDAVKVARARPKIGRVRLCLDGVLKDEHKRLVAELERARAADASANQEPTAPAVARRVVEAEAEMDDVSAEFVFEGKGRGGWRRMKADFPPTEQDVAHGADFDSDRFPFHAMAECLVTPTSIEIDGEDVVLDAAGFMALEDVLDDVQFETLWFTCIQLHTGDKGSVNRPESAAARSVLEQSARLKSVPQSDSGSREAS